jgi:hypothetical protein
VRTPGIGGTYGVEGMINRGNRQIHLCIWLDGFATGTQLFFEEATNTEGKDRSNRPEAMKEQKRRCHAAVVRSENLQFILSLCGLQAIVLDAHTGRTTLHNKPVSNCLT